MRDNMKLSDYLAGVGRPVSYFPKLRRITGSTNATIFFCQFFYWTGKEASGDGWIYKTSADIEEETGLSYKEQTNAREKLRSAGLLLEKNARLEHQMYFKINLDALNSKWGNDQEGVPELTDGKMADNPLGGSLISNTENTSENTTPEKILSSKEKQTLKGLQAAIAMGRPVTQDDLAAPDPVEDTLVVLEKGIHRNIPRAASWQELAKWINKRAETEPLPRWITWYMSDKFRVENAWRLTSEQIRSAWPQAFPVETPKPTYYHEVIPDGGYATPEQIEAIRKGHEK